jgi:hypothetical protein
MILPFGQPIPDETFLMSGAGVPPAGGQDARPTGFLQRGQADEPRAVRHEGETPETRPQPLPRFGGPRPLPVVCAGGSESGSSIPSSQTA